MFQYKRILVPLDGSMRAEKALAPAMKLARAMSAEVVLLRVVPTLKTIAPFVHIDVSLKNAHVEQKRVAENYLKGARMMVYKDGDVGIKTAVVGGRSADAIFAYVQEHDVDLIILSSHGGTTGMGRWRYGEVAMKLLLNAPCSTLVVRTEDEQLPLQFKRMLLPLDGSEEAEVAIEPAMSIAQQMNSETILYRVTAPIELAVGEEVAKTVTTQVKGQVDHYLQAVRGRWSKVQPNISTQVDSGPAAQSILAYAQETNIDLIALATHGASGKEMTLPLGGVADKVVRGARRAVLLIRP